MSHPLVVNLHRERYDVYIGRPGKGLDGPWGNPYEIGPGCTRAEAIQQFERYLLGRPELLARLQELRGKVLGCFCAPLPCHGDVLARMANAGGDGQGSLFAAEPRKEGE